MTRIANCLLLFFLFSGTLPANDFQQQGNNRQLHVPSPEWQDQIIYFIMIDRFNDGDSTNNDQARGEYDPADHRKFSGGDLQGIIDRLDYIRELGASTVWITPPVANLWWDPLVNYGGYHGYWAENFQQLDAHFGSLDTYKELSGALHQRGMYLIQDIVTNHTGNFFDYRDGYDPADPARFFQLNSAAVPHRAPTQSPFDLNDINNPAHRQAGIYHWTPRITDFSDATERLTYQLSGLDDLNTTNPAVQDALKKAYSYWIKEVGVDGYRIDTVIYCEHDFWYNFIQSKDPESPGIEHAARESGREDFLTFGEAFIGSEPLNDQGDRDIASYLGSAEKPELKAVLNFPLYFTMNRVFASGAPSAYMGYRLQTLMNREIYPNPHIIPAFIDNHDVQRFINTAKPVALKQALMLMMTIPGIPVIYQGTEHMFTKSRTAMFAGGWGSGGTNHFSQSGEMFQYIRSLSGIRKDNRVFTRGNLALLADSPVGPGALAYRREYGNTTAIVIFNTADQPALLGNMSTGLPPATRLLRLEGWGLDKELYCNARGELTLELPPRAAAVYLADGKTDLPPVQKASMTLDTKLNGTTQIQDFSLSGSVSGKPGLLKLVIDGILSSAIDIPLDKNGIWQVDVPLNYFPFGSSRHTLQVYAPKVSVVSEVLQLSTEVDIDGLSVSISDPLNDDTGPAGNYLLPRNSTFGGQMDIEAVTATAFGGNLQVTLTMREFTDIWRPANGFDHVVFHVFIDLPDLPGQSLLPRMNATAPAGFEWNYLFYAGGWNSALYHFEGATADNFGTLSTPAPGIGTDKEARQITFRFAPAALGYPATLAGTKIYVSTWDGGGSDGFHRDITPDGASFEFGGGDAGSARILDDTDVIVISEQKN